ncbi:hypothetical protein R1sor_016985 [Riccia sorocarpa]|uniref:Uncharacterized protein n=1 Tax=Riccia sorocarpa TaxID=122646 RepID=A0ABD3I5W8_9MARC
MDMSQDEALDDAALKLLRFLGEVYVNLQEVQAVEEYVCEQYKESIRFLTRCSSDASDGTSSSNDLVKSGFPSTNGTLRTPEDKEQNMTGTHNEASKQEQELAALSEYLDTVLAAAQAVREGSDLPPTHYKGGDKVQGQKLASRKEPGGPCRVKHGPVAKVSTKAVKLKSEMNVACVSRNGKKLRRPSSRVLNSDRDISEKTVKSPRSLVTGSPEDQNKKQIMETDSIHAFQSNEDSLFGQPLSVDSKAPSLSIGEEELSIKPTSNCRTALRVKLQFPEKYRKLRRWFKAREAYQNNTYATPRICLAAEEAFMSMLNDLNTKNESPEEDEYEDEASPILELQYLMEDIASRGSNLDILRLHRLAPRGSKIEELRDLVVHNFSPCEREDGTKGMGQKTNSLEPSQACWLPQSCWKHLDRVLSEQLAQLSDTGFGYGTVKYTEPEQVAVIARLSHYIQETLFHCYLEEEFGSALLRRCPRKDEEQKDMTVLLRCQLAHSLLCKEGRGLFVLAERVTATV